MSPLPFWQQCVIIALCSLASMLSRFLPFLLFKPGASLPSYIRYLGKRCRLLSSRFSSCTA